MGEMFGLIPLVAEKIKNNWQILCAVLSAVYSDPCAQERDHLLIELLFFSPYFSFLFNTMQYLSDHSVGGSNATQRMQNCSFSPKRTRECC